MGLKVTWNRANLEDNVKVLRRQHYNDLICLFKYTRNGVRALNSAGDSVGPWKREGNPSGREQWDSG